MEVVLGSTCLSTNTSTALSIHYQHSWRRRPPLWVWRVSVHLWGNIHA